MEITVRDKIKQITLGDMAIRTAICKQEQASWSKYIGDAAHLWGTCRADVTHMMNSCQISRN